MKLAKLSLAAIVALSVSAFADVENVKFSGNAKLFYGTNDADVWSGALATHNVDGTLFDKDNAYGQVAANVAISADLADGVAGKLRVTGLATLGLENNLVSDTWAGPLGGVSSQWWVSEAWLAKTFGNTTIKVGRQELDTPLAFSEKWNIAENTFDAAVVLNNDLPDTTLVAAWVGRGNGTAGAVVVGATNGSDPFSTYVNEGAYAFAAITKLIPMTTAQIWYYNVMQVAQAWWLQADVNLDEMAPGLSFGIQYANIDPDAAGADTASAVAVKLGYAMDNLKLAAAYSTTDSDGAVPVANTATGLVGAQTKLYTEAWWNYGYVGRNDTDTFMLSAEYNMEDIADFYAQYTNSDGGKKAGNIDMSEFTLTASKSFGNLDATVAYIYTDADNQNNGSSFNTVQVYLTYNF